MHSNAKLGLDVPTTIQTKLNKILSNKPLKKKIGKCTSLFSLDGNAKKNIFLDFRLKTTNSYLM